MKTQNYYERGGVGAGFIFAGVIFFILGYFYFHPVFVQKDPVKDTADCYIRPENSTASVMSEGVEYILIKAHAPTIKIEMPIHFELVEDVTINGKQYPLYKAKENEIAAAPTTEGGGIYRPLQRDISTIRFVDKSSENDPTYSLATPGLADVAIYLEKGQPVPGFILEYCAAGFPVSPLTFFQDTYGNSIPPLEFDPKTIGQPNTKYRLFAYDKKGSFSFAVGTSNRLTAKAQYTFTSGGQTVKYNAFHLRNSPPETITLVNADPTAYDAEIGYRYTFAANVPLLKPPVDLHQKNPLQKDMLQIEAFLPFQVPPWGWWTPECKPAVYLYPEKEQLVNVQVAISDGFLTYTDPLYPKTGWNVLAKPSGELRYLGNDFADSRGKVNYASGLFPYLYYEGKVSDAAVSKPEQGFVIAYEKLANFYDEFLPKLGLNQKESKEFKDYWLKALPKASYYFIGFIPQEQLDQNEPLTITPKQDTMIRVRLYFEALEKPQQITAPKLQSPTRNGFTVVDWGGMVKRDKKHPFTCVE